MIAGERQAMKAILSLVSQGVESLSTDRKETPDGSAKEAAVLAALRLLHACLQTDREIILILKASNQNSECTTFSRQKQISHPSARQLSTPCSLSWILGSTSELTKESSPTSCLLWTPFCCLSWLRAQCSKVSGTCGRPYNDEIRSAKKLCRYQFCLQCTLNLWRRFCRGIPGEYPAS